MNAIECIILDMSKIKEVQLDTGIFKNMPTLRMLYFYGRPDLMFYQSNVILPKFLESLPDCLKVLHWDAYPLKFLLCPKNLVKLDMCNSHLEQLWNDDQVLQPLCCVFLSLID